MANFSVTGVVLTFTVLFFFTFPLCYARLRPTTNLPENVINIGTDFPISLLHSEVNPMIRFPIDVTESQLAEMIGEKETGSFEITEMLPANETVNNDLPKKLPESDTGAAASDLVEKLPESESDTGAATTELVKKMPESEVVPSSEQLPEMETVTVKSIPLRLARYRPVIRPCHHSHHRHHHLFRENMIVPTGENGDFNRVIIHNQLHRIPPRWSSIPYLHHHHHHYHHHDDDSNNEESNSMFKRSARFNKEKFNKHFHHHDHEQHEGKSFNRKMKNQKLNDSTKTKETTGLFNRIRKMMISF